MVRIGISEFSFGFAFLHEQTVQNWPNIVAAPVLPSLKREAQEGWDAHLPTQGIDYYYQFKLSDYLERSNAKFIREGIYSSPYYRISLHRRNQSAQHNRLKAHSARNPHTYYVTPEVRTKAQFDRAFQMRRVTENTRLIPVVDCDEIHDNEQHYITFQPGGPRWTPHSEFRWRKNSVPGIELESLYRRSSKQWKTIDEEFATSLYETVAATVPEDFTGEQVIETKAKPNRGDLLMATQRLLGFLGLNLVIVGVKE